MNHIMLKQEDWHFEGKEEGEEVILVLHKHWLTLASQATFIIIFSILPFVMLVVFSNIIVTYKLISVFSFLWVGYYLLLWFWLFYIITMYTLDNWVVTTKRIIDSVQNGFFNRSVAELHLEKIQDVSYTIEGLMATFFNYGLVEIQTAGIEHKFFFRKVPDPQKVKDIIMKLILQDEDAEGESLRDSVLHNRVRFHQDDNNRHDNSTRNNIGDTEPAPITQPETPSTENAGKSDNTDYVNSINEVADNKSTEDYKLDDDRREEV